VDLTLGQKAVQLRNTIAWPGQTNSYRVDFRVPGGTAPGMATIQLVLAWIPGPQVNIPVQ
jgi:hypothetical protein